MTMAFLFRSCWPSTKGKKEPFYRCNYLSRQFLITLLRLKVPVCSRTYFLLGVITRMSVCIKLSIIFLSSADAWLYFPCGRNTTTWEQTAFLTYFTFKSLFTCFRSASGPIPSLFYHFKQKVKQIEIQLFCFAAKFKLTSDNNHKW